jgi:hypothetical protein
MKQRNVLILVFSLLALALIGVVYLLYSNFGISADLATEGKFCTVKIGGAVSLSHIALDNQLVLKLVDGDKLLAENQPKDDQYEFIVSGQVPSNGWRIEAEEKIASEKINYVVVSLNDLKCDSSYNIDLKF